jgi:hypothetical protein
MDKFNSAWAGNEWRNMKLIEILNQYRFDFDGILECEHCGSNQTVKNGYDDTNYHVNVIPKITCINCSKCRDGTIGDPHNIAGGKLVHKIPKTIEAWAFK